MPSTTFRLVNGGNFMSRNRICAGRLTLDQAQSLSEAHEHVEYFADKFISAALGRNPLTGEKMDAAPVSRLERTRLMIAFYRFELFCKLSPQNDESKDMAGYTSHL